MNVELSVNIPNSMRGEFGEPLDFRIRMLVLLMAEFGYWPLDFGEDDGETTELIFSCVETPGTSPREIADHFLKDRER